MYLMVWAISTEIEIAVYYVYWYLAENVDYAIFFSPSFTAMRWWSVYGSGLLTVCRFVRGLMMRSSVSPRVWVGSADILAEAILLQEAVEHHSVSSLTEVSKQDQIGRFLACVCKLWRKLWTGQSGGL